METSAAATAARCPERGSPDRVGLVAQDRRDGRDGPKERAVSENSTGRDESVDVYARARAYESVRAVLSDDHNYAEGVAAVRRVAAAVVAEAGVAALADVVVGLSLELASALERIAAEQGMAAVDLADVWFVD
jgi:hypothetical protein